MKPNRRADRQAGCHGIWKLNSRPSVQSTHCIAICHDSFGGEASAAAAAANAAYDVPPSCTGGVQRHVGRAGALLKNKDIAKKQQSNDERESLINRAGIALKNCFK